MAQIHLGGEPIHTIGELPTVGSPAPDFKLTDKELADKSLADFKGQKKLLNIVPSLDTPVCAESTRRFNQALNDKKGVVCLVISADLPFAQDRFCSTEGLDRVIPLSMMRDKQFGKDYGILIVDGPLQGLLGRAIVIIDENDQVIYTQLVPEIKQEPDYDAALSALE